MLLLRGKTLYTPHQQLTEQEIFIENGFIQSIQPQNEQRLPEGIQVVDTGNDLIVPGFVDLQLNGGFGMDFTKNPESIWEVAQLLPRFGVTAFLPTIITSPLSTVAAAMDVIKKGSPKNFRGALPLGLHLEGPFLNPAKKGAHNPTLLQLPTQDKVADWTLENGVRLVTLAPELPEALELIRILCERGMVVSAGHSAASYAEAETGIAAGVRYGTHIFNAMSALQHRDPGLPGALLTREELIVGLIADGIHLHPAMVDLVWKMKGNRRLTLVSDAMAALGMAPGKYELGFDFEVTVDDNSARLADGTLAGSILSPDQALRNFIQMTGCSLFDALPLLTSTPANVLGNSQMGSLEIGNRADIVVLNQDGFVQMTIAAGEIIYQS
ncbi:MAG: N-acetylglucosamine-6-phosphate deacetylase [Anaerolineaceae bacterium]|nr:N-acetylglucosamine-6-phosphate deacetylase [Anaerolineaceae bacterium]